VKRFAAAFCGFAALFPSLPARADTPLVDSYALALRYFNPQLNDLESESLATAAIQQADLQRLDARLLVAVIAVESRWNPSAVSPAGARGLGQLMPETAAGLRTDPDDPYSNIAAAARYLRDLVDRFRSRGVNRYQLALAAYNAGPGAVARYGGIPPYAETRAYVARVLKLWRRLAGWS
jgi:soluble lytic murein transglycosylase-like protein